MRDSVYMAGGINARYNILSSCERYDLNKKEWFSCQKTLPYPLCDAPVVVNPEETFAVITGGVKDAGAISDEIIIFTEEYGFEVLKNSTLKRKIFNHISILLP